MSHTHTHCPSTSICINVIQSTFPGPPIVLHSVGSEFRPPSRLDLGSCDGYRFSAKIWQQYSLISYRLAGLSNISSISFPCNQSWARFLNEPGWMGKRCRGPQSSQSSLLLIQKSALPSPVLVHGVSFFLVTQHKCDGCMPFPFKYCCFLFDDV